MKSEGHLTRRKFLGNVGIGIAAVSAMGMARPLEDLAARRAKKRFNILYIMTDEQTVSGVGAFGNKIIKTPNLDKLAAEGCKLSKTYIASFPCCPSRASQFTGRYLQNHGVFQNEVPLDENIPSLGMICSKAGYETAYFGKWHLGGHVYRGISEHPSINMPEWHKKRVETPDGWKGVPTPGGPGEDFPQCGFKTWAGGYMQYHEWLKKNGQGQFLEKYKGKKFGAHQIAAATAESQHNYSLVPEEYHVEAFIAGQAVDFIDKQKDASKPWCTVVSFYGPHSPVAPPKPWDEMYSLDEVVLPANHRDELIDKPRSQRNDRKYVLDKWTDNQFKDYIRRYWGFCSYIDNQIGRVFYTLHKTGQWDNTIIVFTSDHGDMVGAHGFYLKSVVNGYDELYRVPTIVRIPGVSNEGSTADSFVSHVDMLPTLLKSVDITVPDGVDGKSFLPLLKNTKSRHRDFVFCDSCNRSIVYCDDNYKYVLNWATADVDDELYDLKKDPGELVNIAFKKENAANVAKIKDRIWAWLKETNHKYADVIAKKGCLKNEAKTS